MSSFIERVRAVFSKPKDDYMNVPPEPVEASSVDRAPRSGRRRSLSRFSSRARKEEQIAALQAGYHEMVGVLGSIREHLEQETKNQKKLLHYMENIPEAVEGLKSVGASARQQTEVLQLVRTQLESSIDHDKHLVQSMNNFNNTLTLMDETNRTASETITSLVDRSRESEDLLRTMLERSERRLVLSIGVMAVITLLVVVSAVYVTRTSRTDAAPASGVTQVEPTEPLVIRSSIAEIPSEPPTPADASDMADEVEADQPSDEVAPSAEEGEAESSKEGETKRRGFLGFGRRAAK